MSSDDLKDRITVRQIGVYVGGACLVAFADPRPMTFAIGACFVCAAWLLRIWAFGHLEKNKAMVTTGPYAYTRNPAYLGSFLALSGVALAAGNPESAQGRLVWGLFAFLAVVFFTYYMPRKFKREYPRLERLFGDDLRRHSENVPNFWPRLTAWSSGDDRQFALARVTMNREWPWGIVLAVLMVAIWYSDRWSPVHAFFEAS